MRLGEAERTEQLAVRERRQEFLLLRLVAVTLQDIGDEVGDHDDGAGCAVAGRNLFAGERECGAVHARAALRFGNRDAVQAHGAKAGDFLARKYLLAVPTRRVRRQALARVAANGVAQLFVVGGEGHARRE